MLNNPVFIIGHPKSGTSLLCAMLDSHPELLVLPEESDYYNLIWPRANLLNYEWRLSKTEKAKLLSEYISKKSHFKNFSNGKVDRDISGNFDYTQFDSNFFHKILIRKLANIPYFTRKTLFHIIAESFANTTVMRMNQKNTRYWVEKTPKHTWFIQEILADFPNSKFIFLYRDPRDNFISYKKKWGEKLTALKFSKSWNDAILQQEKIPASQLYKMQYENLTINPFFHIQDLCTFLDIEYLDCLLQPSKLGIKWKGNSMFKKNLDTISPVNIGHHRDAIDAEDLKIIESFCADNMIKLGYNLNIDNKVLEATYTNNHKNYRKLKLNNYNFLQTQLVKLKIILTGEIKKKKT